MSLFSGLNSRQQDAVRHIDGPLLIVAGAGAGKTKTLTHRIAYMIEQGIPAWNILAVTFTNKAAKEMVHRIDHLLQNQEASPSSKPTMGTFHSICSKLLRTEIEILGYERDFAIYDSQDQLSALKEVLKSIGIDEEEAKPKMMISIISSYKNQLLTPSMVKNLTTNAFEERMAKIYSVYQAFLQKNNALDFDDLIMLTVRLFEEHPHILEKYQYRWQYISVDEYQDTNHAQYKLIKMLAKKHRNLCVIGDSDQAIYSFRGADIQNILRFEQEFPDALIIKLEQNYRSTQNILGAANNLIDNNSIRVPKHMWTENNSGSKIQVWEKRSEYDEAESIAAEIIKKTRTEGLPFSSFVILYRTNAQSRVIEEAFLRNQISYSIIGGLRFYSRKEVKDILAYLRMLQNPSDSVSLLRIINVPARKIGASSLLKVQHFAEQRNMSLFEVLQHVDVVDNLTPAAKNALRQFLSLYERLKEESKKQALSEFIETVIRETGYKQMVNDGSVEGISRMENLEELRSVAARYDIYDEEALGFFLEEVSLVQDADSIQEEKDNVLLMTVHAAKGLEFDTVFITGVEEEIFPHSQGFENPQQLEEERRLMYVAMTRARKSLYMSYATQRLLFGQTAYHLPSRFLSEISEDFLEISSFRKQPTYDRTNDVKAYSAPVDFDDRRYSFEDSQVYEMPEYKEGMMVEHQVFGQGTIVAIHGMVLTISFGPGNVRKLAANIAPLKVVD